jgi:hypothetical protein
MAKATAAGRTFEDKSWNGIVSRIAAANRLSTTPRERVEAAGALADGQTVTLGGVRIIPAR